MIGRTLFLAVLALTGVTLAACSSMRTQPVPDLTFAHLAPITLNVASVDVAAHYQSSTTPPHVEGKFPIPPEEALKRWAQDRLRAVGTAGVAGVARFTVLNAAVTEQPLPKTTGFVGAFSTEPDKCYTATVDATVDIADDSGRRASVSASATRSRTLKEGLTPEERNLEWFNLTRDIMNDFNAQMEGAIRQNLNQWVM